MNGRNLRPTLRRAKGGEWFRLRLQHREGLRELLKIGLPILTKHRVEHRFSNDEITLRHRQSLESLVLRGLEKGIFLRRQLLERINRHLVAIDIEQIAMHRKRFAKHGHCRGLFAIHRRVDRLTQHAQVSDADGKPFIKLPCFRKAIHLSRDIGADGVQGLEIGKIHRDELAIKLHGRSEPALNKPRIDTSRSVGNPEHLAVLQVDERLAHHRVRLGPLGDLGKASHAWVNRGLIELFADFNGRFREIEIRRKQASRALAILSHERPRRIEFREHLRRLRVNRAGHHKQ